MKKLLIIYSTICFVAYAQTTRIGFYNVENLFDTIDDPQTNDNEFLPTGNRKWNSYKYYEKLTHIYKTITAMSEWNKMAIVGLCEVENRSVLYDLVMKTPFVKNKYEIIHQDSPDKRGIDVAAIYNPKLFRPISTQFIRVDISDDSSSTTRDILYIEGKINKVDTIHLFYNHWSSRSGGQMASEPKRIKCAKTLKNHTDSILKLNPNAYIIILGDFNDEPNNISLTEGLVVKNDTVKNGVTPYLFNTMFYYYQKGIGTEKHQDHWNVLDQIIISSALINGTKISATNSTIFNAHWLITNDEKYFGDKPFRTYSGPNYLGGYSDHLPIYIDLVKNK